MLSEFSGFDYLIVGAGFYGAVLAERLANDARARVLVIDRKNHIGGNSFSRIDPATGIEVHCYGSHIFHTADEEVWRYLNRFGAFSNYRHKVLIERCGKIYFMPINLKTINEFYNARLRPGEVAGFIAGEAGNMAEPRNLEEKAIALIGRPLYEAFIKTYTAKQWECDPTELPAAIITRLPIRSNYNTDYFNDCFQGIPLDGYGTLFSRMLNHPNIKIMLNTDFNRIRTLIPRDCRIIYTGALDRFFDYRFGALEWRTLRFEWETHPVADYQGAAVMNYGDLEVPYTRIHEFKHYHPERTEVFQSSRTVVCKEYSKRYTVGDEAFYPINNERNNQLYARYRDLAAATPGLYVGGRLGAYSYWDMDKACGYALKTYKTLNEKKDL